MALSAAGLREPPEALDELLTFLRGPVFAALSRTAHAPRAQALIDDAVYDVEAHYVLLLEAGPDEVITRPPPPADPAAHESYEDLATGAVHTRATPAWGTRAARGPDAPDTVWLIVSQDGELLRTAQKNAPPSVDVVHASSVAVLNGAVGRSKGNGAVILDAGHPSLPLERVAAALAAAPTSTRVVVWRMSLADREALAERDERTRAWLPCDAEVTPQEIVQLLTL